MVEGTRDSMMNKTKFLPSWNMHTEIKHQKSTEDPRSQEKGQQDGMMGYHLGEGWIRPVLGLAVKGGRVPKCSTVAL